jgi:hypothetical protein
MAAIKVCFSFQVSLALRVQEDLGSEQRGERGKKDEILVEINFRLRK